jgi:hypothetical protein
VVAPLEATPASVARLSVQPWVKAEPAVEPPIQADIGPQAGLPRELPITIRPLVPAPHAFATPQVAGGPILDTALMTSKPLDGAEIFAGLRSQLPNLQIEQRFFESATMADSLRAEPREEGLVYWNPTGFCWQSPAFCHSPLYFEQVNYERYGQGKGRPWAPALSAAHFVSHVTTLPIAMFCTPPWTKACTLGHHRPGNCAPIQRKPEHL